MAATAAQYAISGMYPMWHQENATRGQMVVTGVSGELHEIGAAMLSDALEAKGWRVRFLGSNVPVGDVLQVIDGNPVDVLCISTTLTANLPATAQLVLSIREQSKRRDLKIVAGGAAYSDSPHFPAQLGVLGGALDLRHAVRLLCP
jgi:methanogenic corrinoid protein MtbC1